MTEQELSEIEARANAATPGPWEENGVDKTVLTERGLIDVRNSEKPADTAKFIAHAREDIPKLIAEVRRLRKMGASKT